VEIKAAERCAYTGKCKAVDLTFDGFTFFLAVFLTALSLLETIAHFTTDS
jgi:hypothetical protein